MSMQPPMGITEKVVYGSMVVILALIYAYFYAAHTSNIGHGKYWFTAIHPFNPTTYTSAYFPLVLDIRIAPTNYRAIRLRLVPKLKTASADTATEAIKASIKVVDLNGVAIDTREGTMTFPPGRNRSHRSTGDIVFVAPAGRYNMEVNLVPASILDSNDLIVEFDSTYR